MADDGDPYVLVFGLPYITNRVAINSEQDIVNVRLLSICPPETLRPYYQEGYLAGTDEVTTDFGSKDELDFNNRLIAKFRLRRGRKFWGQGFNALPRDLLYPPNDRMEAVCSDIRTEVGTEADPGRLGAFLQEWTQLEALLMLMAREAGLPAHSSRSALDSLAEWRIADANLINRLHGMRKLRNQAVLNLRRSLRSG